MSDRRAGYLFAAVATALFGGLALAQRRHRLRAAVETPESHTARNMSMAGLAAAAVSVAENPVVVPLSRWAAARRVGITFWLQRRFGLSAWARDAVAVILLDYTLYIWHVLEHRLPVLYRFHAVHHCDLDLDVSTALRFHFGELISSVPWRAAQITVIGVSPRALTCWQRLTLVSVMFHHSNVRLPWRVEHALSRLITTPRLHGIHHSIVQEEQDSNWSSGLTVWDFLHGTYRGDVPQSEITIGVAALRSPASVALGEIVALPFQHLPDLHLLPDGRPPGAPGQRAGDRDSSAGTESGDAWRAA